MGNLPKLNYTTKMIFFLTPDRAVEQEPKICKFASELRLKVKLCRKLSFWDE